MSSTEILASAPEETAEGSNAQAPEHDQAHSQEETVAPADGEQTDRPAVNAPTLNPECTREIAVEIPAVEVATAFRSILKNYTRQARIPGFRAGKVPPSLIRSRFDEQIRQDVVEQLLPRHFRSALDAQGIQPISQPQVTELHLEDGDPLRFKALFEVMPEINLDGYQDVKAERQSGELTDEEFEVEMERVRDSRSTMEPVTEDRELTDGDFAQISFQGEVAGENPGEALLEPIAGQDVQLEVGGKNTMPAFTEALRGAKPGQELKFEVTYPAEFGEERLAGRTIGYNVEVKGIKHRNAPEMNDDFAKELGEYETMDEFRSKLREHLSGEKQTQAEAATKDKILEGLAAKYTFPLPETLVQQHVEARLERGLRALAQQGMTPEMMRGMDFGRLRAAQRDAALGETRGTMILDRIAQLENIEVSDEEVEGELAVISAQMREPLETLRERFKNDGTMTKIREQMRRERTGSLLYERLAS